ncbi:hypothetical protein LZ30DRAFT_219316 [Colletotrichum cereale]|nr:hypothetical protein LZ30DRAFT_219316 [Colletotrichum cereale]
MFETHNGHRREGFRGPKRLRETRNRRGETARATGSERQPAVTAWYSPAALEQSSPCYGVSRTIVAATFGGGRWFDVRGRSHMASALQVDETKCRGIRPRLFYPDIQDKRDGRATALWPTLTRVVEPLFSLFRLPGACGRSSQRAMKGNDVQRRSRTSWTMGERDWRRGILDLDVGLTAASAKWKMSVTFSRNGSSSSSSSGRHGESPAVASVVLGEKEVCCLYRLEFRHSATVPFCLLAVSGRSFGRRLTAGSPLHRGRGWDVSLVPCIASVFGRLLWRGLVVSVDSWCRSSGLP